MIREPKAGVLRSLYLALWFECLIFCLIQLLLVPAIVFGDSWLSGSSGLNRQLAQAVQWGVQHYPASFSVFNLLLIPVMVSVFLAKAGWGLRPSRLEVGLMMTVLTLLLPFQIGIFVVSLMS